MQSHEDCLVLVAAPLPDGRTEKLQRPEGHVEPGDDGQEDEPEPEKDVDLLVHDIHAQHAERVQPLNGARRPVLVEGALGHPGEDPGHGVHPLLRVHGGELQDLQAVDEELSPEEGVRDKNLREKFVASPILGTRMIETGC